MKKYLYIIGDTNDADWASQQVEISEKKLKSFKPLIKAIKNFKPYVTKTEDGEMDWTHRHNFNIGEGLRDDLGEKSVEEIYKGIVSEDVFDDFICSFVPANIHSIKSIELLEITSRKKLV